MRVIALAESTIKQYSDGVQRVRDSKGRIVGYRVELRRPGSKKIAKRFKRLDKARAWRINHSAKIQAGFAVAADGKRRLRDVIDAYLADAGERLKPSTIKDRTNRLRWWKKRLGSLVFRDLTASMVQEELATLTCVPATKNRYLTALSAALKYAQGLQWIGDNPARGVPRGADNNERERVITGPEWKALMKATKEMAGEPDANGLTQQLPNYLQLLYATGMRAGEALHLHWSDVDLDNDRIVLDRRSTKTHTKRSVPLDSEAIAALKDQERFRSDRVPWVFRGRNPAKPASRFNHRFAEAKRRAGIGADENGEPLVLHSLRHSFATELADGGADLFELMAATGHRSIASAQRYIKTKEDQARRAIAKRRRA